MNLTSAHAQSTITEFSGKCLLRPSASSHQRSRWPRLHILLAIMLLGLQNVTASPRRFLSSNVTSINFGTISIATSSTAAITLTNTGNPTISISQVTVTGTGFGLSGLSLPLSLSAGQSVTFSAIFAPTTVGGATGSISVVSNASNSPATISLAGTGTALQLTASPSSISFGNVNVGNSGTQSLSIVNNGTGAVTLSRVSVSGTAYSVNGPSVPLTLAAGQAVSFNVVFAPASAAITSGSISIVSNASSSPATIPLSGTGVSLLLSMQPGSLSFGNVVLGTNTLLPVLLSNPGIASVTISQVAVTGSAFTVSGLSLPLTLAPGQNTSFSVGFDPIAPGSATGNVSIVSNATNSPLKEPLSGTGIHGATLSWAASTSIDIAGYDVYRGSSSGGPYTLLNASPIPGTSYLDTTVQAAQTYYYVVTAVNSSNLQSTDSNEATAIVPSP